MFLIWIIIIGLLQITILQDINLLVVIACLSGVKYGHVKGLLTGMMIGAFAEILSGSTFGYHLVLFSLVGLVSGLVRSSISYKESIFTKILFSFFAVILFYLGCFILTGVFFAPMFSIALLSAAVSPLIFKVVK